MSDTAFQKQYRQEFIAGFEYGESRLRGSVITETQMKGNEAIFLVADTGGAEAVTRGVDGRIPSRPDNLNQFTCLLQEWHDKVERTSFNIFASQGDGRRIMQETGRKVIMRKIDSDIITQLDTATVTAGAAAKATVGLFEKSLTILGNSEVDVEEEDNMFALVTPAYRAYMRQIPEFNNGDWVEIKVLNRPVQKYWRWGGVNWITHPRLTGAGTASETCFLFHRNSIGHAANVSGMDVRVGYDEQDDFSWGRHSIFMGSKILQNQGIVKMLHDGSEYVA
jgi:hypothetical protein